MLTDDARACLLAQHGPTITQAMTAHTGAAWCYERQANPCFAVMRRERDGMALGLLPGWWQHAARFEIKPFVQHAGGEPADLRSLGVVSPDSRPLCIHVTVTRGPAPVARDIVRRLLAFYDPLFPKVRERLDCERDGLSEQGRIAREIARRAGCEAVRERDSFNLYMTVGGVRLYVRVGFGGAVEVQRLQCDAAQVLAIMEALSSAAVPVNA